MAAKKPSKDYPTKEEIAKAKLTAARRKPITQDTRSGLQKIQQVVNRGKFMGKANLPYKEGQVQSTKVVKPKGITGTFATSKEKKGTTVTTVSKYKPKGPSKGSPAKRTMTR